MSDELPSGWTETTLQELGRWCSGGTPSRVAPEYYGPGVPWVKTGELRDGWILQTEESITPDGLENSSAKLLPAGSLLLAMYGATIGRVGRIAMDAACNQACAAFIAEGLSAELIPYLFHYLRFRRDHFRTLAQGGAQPNISQTIVTGQSCALPPLPEQRRIVAKLDAFNARSRSAKEALDAIPELIENFKRSVLAAAFRGGLTADWREKHPDVEPASALLKSIRVERRRRWEEAELERMRAARKEPKDERWKAKYVQPEAVHDAELSELPHGWCWASVSELSELQLGQQRAPVHAEAEETHPYVRAANIKWNGLDLSDVKRMGFPDVNRYLLNPGDVLLSEASGSPTEVGKPAVWRGEIQGCCYQKTLLRARPVSTDASSDWLYLSFLADALLGRFARMAPGVGILHLTADRMLSWPVPLAPRQEQSLLIAAVNSALAAAARLEDLVRTAAGRVEQFHHSILAKAFRGELVPQDPGDEPASVLLERIHAERENSNGTNGHTAQPRRRGRTKGARREARE